MLPLRVSVRFVRHLADFVIVKSSQSPAVDPMRWLYMLWEAFEFIDGHTKVQPLAVRAEGGTSDLYGHTSHFHRCRSDTWLLLICWSGFASDKVQDSVYYGNASDASYPAWTAGCLLDD